MIQISPGETHDESMTSSLTSKLLILYLGCVCGHGAPVSLPPYINASEAIDACTVLTFVLSLRAGAARNNRCIAIDTYLQIICVDGFPTAITAGDKSDILRLVSASALGTGTNKVVSENAIESRGVTLQIRIAPFSIQHHQVLHFATHGFESSIKLIVGFTLRPK